MSLTRFFFTMTSAALLVTAADLNRGKDLYSQGNYNDAEKELRAVVEGAADNAQAHLFLGRTLLALDRAADAERHLTRANEIESTGDTKLGLAQLYLKQKDLDKAEAAIKDAAGDELEFVRGQIHLARDRHEEAARDLEQAAEKQPSNAYAHYYAGLAYNNLRRPDKMMTHFEMFLKMKPDAPEARKVRSVLRSVR